MPPLTTENDAIQNLLAEVRQTICDNHRFLRRLKEDDADLESADGAPDGGAEMEEAFE